LQHVPRLATLTIGLYFQMSEELQRHITRAKAASKLNVLSANLSEKKKLKTVRNSDRNLVPWLKAQRSRNKRQMKHKKKKKSARNS